MLSDDVDLFFDTSEFAVEAVYNGGSRVTVIFERPYITTDMGSIPSEARQPHVLGRESEFPNVVPGHTLRINGVTYEVVTPIQPDGTGIVTLMLKRKPT